MATADQSILDQLTLRMNDDNRRNSAFVTSKQDIVGAVQSCDLVAVRVNVGSWPMLIRTDRIHSIVK